MNLVFRSNGSAHVRLSEKASAIFRNTKRGDEIIKAISDRKKEISDGKSITVETPNDTEYNTVSVERVSETHVDKQN